MLFAKRLAIKGTLQQARTMRWLSQKFLRGWPTFSNVYILLVTLKCQMGRKELPQANFVIKYCKFVKCHLAPMHPLHKNARSFLSQSEINVKSQKLSTHSKHRQKIDWSSKAIRENLNTSIVTQADLKFQGLKIWKFVTDMNIFLCSKKFCIKTRPFGIHFWIMAMDLK